jgi:hypothetical protein
MYVIMNRSNSQKQASFSSVSVYILRSKYVSVISQIIGFRSCLSKARIEKFERALGGRRDVYIFSLQYDQESTPTYKALQVWGSAVYSMHHMLLDRTSDLFFTFKTITYSPRLLLFKPARVNSIKEIMRV